MGPCSLMKNCESGVLDTKRLFCLLCKTTISHRENTIGDIMSHLKRKDHEEFLKTTESEKSASEQRSFMMEWRKKQAPLSHERVKEMNDALLRLIILDCQPFSIVTDHGFKSFVSMLEPRFKLPARTTLSDARLCSLKHWNLHGREK
jgi:hypothetical protein